MSRTTTARCVLEHSFCRNPIARPRWQVPRQADRGSVARTLTTGPPRATELTSSLTRLDQDEPFDRTGGSPKAFQSQAKPDFFLKPKSFSHPIPRFTEDSPASSLSLKLEHGHLDLEDKSDGRLTRIPGRWLRDNCSCKQCRNQDTAQRQITVLKGDLDCTIAKLEPSSTRSEGFTITFGDGHTSYYPAEFFFGRRGSKLIQQRLGITQIKIWQEDIANAPPTVSYADFTNADGMGALLQNIRTYGFCFLDGMPATPEASESALQAIGPIRNTHYGAFYDFTSDLSSKDTAYTSESLEPHTDNTYFTEPAGLQALHMLSHTDGSGGESSLVDGFGAAVQLYVEDREAYLRLSETGVYAHASGNDGISIQPSQAFPTLSHDSTHGFLTQVRWNNADRAGVATDFAHLDAWYDAAAKFDAILSDVKNQYWSQMKPGRMLIFDNWRVLHGRAAFTGKRRMCGAYINRDDFISKYRQTNQSKEDLAFATVSG